MKKIQFIVGGLISIFGLSFSFFTFSFINNDGWYFWCSLLIFGLGRVVATGNLDDDKKFKYNIKSPGSKNSYISFARILVYSVLFYFTGYLALSDSDNYNKISSLPKYHLSIREFFISKLENHLPYRDYMVMLAFICICGIIYNFVYSYDVIKTTCFKCKRTMNITDEFNEEVEHERTYEAHIGTGRTNDGEEIEVYESRSYVYKTTYNYCYRLECPKCRKVNPKYVYSTNNSKELDVK